MSEILIDEYNDDLTTQAIRATVTAQSLGIEVTMRRQQVNITVYPKSYYLDICRLFQASFDHRKWRMSK